MNPYVVPAPSFVGVRGFCVAGTAYGLIHRIDGSIRVWRSYSGAWKAARRYIPLQFC